MRIALSILLALHGAIHLLGFIEGFGLATVDGLELPIGHPARALWLLVAVGFGASAVMLHVAPRYWSIVGLPSLVLSQALIVCFWADARFATIPNAILVVPIILAMLELRPGSFPLTYERESERHLALVPSSAPIVTDRDLESLPPLVQKFLRRVGVVGRPRVLGFSARFHGRFRQGVEGRWMKFTSAQHNFVDPSTRLFLMRASLLGLPIDGYHDFVGDEARFRVRVLSIFEVIKGHGPEMNRGETVTIFNDLCFMAPGALVGTHVRWSTIGPRSVQGFFTRGEQTVSAILTFNDQGDLVDFVSEDRFYSADGKTFRTLPWSTPLRGHRDFEGTRLPARGDATWKTPEGDFVYGEFNLDEITYFPVGGTKEG